MAHYWGPGDPVQGPIFKGRGGAAIATGKVTLCICLQNIIRETRHIFMFESFKGKGDNKLSIRDLANLIAI